jgi:hypothetical protein
MVVRRDIYTRFWWGNLRESRWDDNIKIDL